VSRSIPVDGRPEGLLSSRDGRLLVAAEVVQAVASGVARIALPILALAGRGTAGDAAIVFAAGIAPYAVLGLLAAVPAERGGRRRIMVAGNVLQAIAALAIPVLVAGAPSLAILVAVSLVLGTGRVFVDAAIFSAVPRLVVTSELVHALGILTVTWSAGQLLGPALGGTLVGGVGASDALAFTSGGFVAAAVLITLIGPGVERRLDVPIRARAMIAGGLRLLVGHGAIRRFTLVGLAWNVVQGAFAAISVPYLTAGVDLSPRGTGAALALYGGSGMLTPLVFRLLYSRLGDGRLVVILSALSAVLLSLLAIGVPTGALFGALALLGVATMSLGGALPAARQRRAPVGLQSIVGTSGRSLNLLGFTSGSLAVGGIVGVTGVDGAMTVLTVAMATVAVVGVPILWRER
jgi:MFS family permease